jgi:peptide deformylase
MLKTQFKDKMEFDLYVAEQKVRMEKGCLTRSERETLKKMLVKEYTPVFIQEEKPKLPIVTNLVELRKPCLEVTKEDNIKEIVQKLKDTFAQHSGIGLSANQIGINKRISYIKIPKIVGKQIAFTELVLINAKIIEQERLIRISNEGCVSFHGIYVNTARYVFITVEYYNEEMKLQTAVFQDLESLCLQHEIDHQNGITLFERKWRAK